MIPVQNIYYMLSYAFQILKEKGYKELATEQFHNTAELCAAILAKGINSQIKRGLNREYLTSSEPLSNLRGKLDISESIKTLTIQKKQLVCTYDRFSVNTDMNRIIKTTALLLMKANIDKSRKKELRSLMMFFNDVEPIDLHTVNWNLQYNRNNRTYQMLIGICRLVYKGLLQTQKDGSAKLMDFFDEQRMHHLYEKFILEYYRQEHPEVTANAAQIPWQLDDGFDEMLPKMQTDIMLTRGTSVLSIDAKYYNHTTQIQYGVNTLHSGNLYQIFTYVKNKEHELAGQEHTVSGMLLYAGTDEDVYPGGTYQMSGNTIVARTLDLNRDFSAIRADLDEILTDMLE